MTSKKLWNIEIDTYSCGVFNSNKFLCYYKNDAILYGSTLYENVMYYNWINPNTGFSEAEYESFFDDANIMTHSDPKRPEAITMFTYIIQYRLRFLYNIPEEITKGEVKTKLLYALTDKIFGNEAILAPLMFFNRQNTNMVSVEIFLFCVNEIDIEYLLHLGECEYEKGESPSIIEKLTKAQALYWHYKWYCELFLNKNILSASAFFF